MPFAPAVGTHTLSFVVGDAQGRQHGGTVTVTVTAELDSDGDTLPDVWETRAGLNPLVSTGADGGTGDPDGDLRSNAQEYADDTHPRGFHRRYFAEGALNTFFDVRLALLNVGLAPASVQVRLLQPGGVVGSWFETVLPARRRTTRRRRSWVHASRRRTSRPSSNPTSRSCWTAP